MRHGLGLLLLALAVGSVLILAAGCGAGATSTTTQVTQPGETSTTQAAGPAGEPVKIGAALPLTGPYAFDGEHMKTGIELAADDLNAAGGVAGRPVEIVYFDIGEGAAEEVDAAAEYLISKEKVAVIVEGYASYGPDFLAFGERSDVPFFNGTASSRAAELATNDPQAYSNMFDVFPLEPDWGRRAWDGIKQFEENYEFPAKRIAVVHGDWEWDLLYTQSIIDEAQKAGWEVVLNETVPYGTTDWGSVLTKLRAANPTAVASSMISIKEISTFVSQFRENPPAAVLDIASMVVYKEVQDAVGDDLIGVMGYVTSYLPATAANDAWKARYKKKFNMDVPLTNPPSTYDSVMIWATAANAVGDPTDYAKICDYVRTNPYQGLSGTYDFNNPGQTVQYGSNFPIAYAQYKGNGELAFYGVDEFILPPWITPAWPRK